MILLIVSGDNSVPTVLGQVTLDIAHCHPRHRRASTERIPAFMIVQGDQC